jgi:hypothetical protein
MSAPAGGSTSWRSCARGAERLVERLAERLDNGRVGKGADEDVPNAILRPVALT